ncbi:MAG: two-component sensor histidine kinase, partial [Planctomycetaceae bacterium]|nr:two-component sensor histidine kinase [Planctomycetaceae bacterium]
RGDALLLVRRARVDGREYVQGCLLDWPSIQVWLQEEIADLLPQASLVATVTDEADPQSLRLASLPVRLVPGNAPFAMQKVWTPLRLSLVLAWIGAGLAALAIAVLLWKSMQLSERRAVFVSAVTHELRTPLTTFRMYTDILAGGRLTDEAKKQRYLDTLRTEAERLGHLVENVLSYAQLEKTREERVCERVELSRLFARVSEALDQRVTQSGMRLMIETPPDDGGQVTGDAPAIERILFNLVDNACKYANDGSDQPIRVTCARHGNKVQIAVEDGGPGMPRGNTEKLFRPFCKSAQDAAKSAPGVGLGLSLCRRLARKMNGNLRVDPEFADGARVVLELPFAS